MVPICPLSCCGRKVSEVEVGEAGRAVVDRNLPDMDTQGLILAGRRLGRRFGAAVGWLGNQQVVHVGGASSLIMKRAYGCCRLTLSIDRLSPCW